MPQKPEGVAPSSPMEERLKELQALIPWAFADGALDVEAIQQLTGAEIATDENRYRFQWAGSKECFKTLRAPAAGALVPKREDSVDFDNTKNLYIEGENLEVLKLLQRAYTERVKMIYIDPPYNTGSDFVYADNFRDPLAQYLRETGQVDESGRATNATARKKEQKANGRKHSRWMAMMFPRLFIARSLLAEDGVIFISIDDHEVHHLRMLMNIVFGEENFVDTFVVRSNPRGNQARKLTASEHEYILCHAKSIQSCAPLGFEKHLDDYPKQDATGHYREIGLRKRGAGSRREDAPNQFYPVYYDPQADDIQLENSGESYVKIFPMLSNGQEGRWRWSKSTVKENKDRLIVRKVKRRNGISEWDVFEIDYFAKESIRKIKSIMNEKEFNYEKGTEEINFLFDKDRVFKYPKPVSLIKHVLMSAMSRDSLAMDFFSGSGTTAHAVMQLNAEDGGKRRCISVQMPEPTPKDSEARKAGYENISQIGRERLRLAGKKIHDMQNGDIFGKEIDIGFRAFTLEQSAFKQWNGTPEATPESVTETLQGFEDLVRDEVDDDTLLHEILLMVALPLTAAREKLQIGNNTVWKTTDDVVDKKPIYICLDRKLEENLHIQLRLSPQDTLVVRDSAMTDSMAAGMAGQCNLRVV